MEPLKIRIEISVKTDDGFILHLIILYKSNIVSYLKVKIIY